MTAAHSFFARLVADTRTSTKIVVSLAAILALTGFVGATGQHFIDVLQQRMDRTAATTDAMTGVQRIVSEIERFAESDDLDAGIRIQEKLGQQTAALRALQDDLASDDARQAVLAASGALGELERHLSDTLAEKGALLASQARLHQTATAIETASLSVSDIGIRLSRDAARDEQAAKDLLKAGNRLAQAAGEIETAARTVAARFAGGADATADGAALETAAAAFTKAVRKSRTAATGPAADQLKAVETLISDLDGYKEPALSGDASARRALTAAATLLAGRSAVLRNTAVSGFSAGIDALADVEVKAVATRGIGEGAGKLNASARKLMLDTVIFVGAPTEDAARSANAQVEQVRQILDVLARDAASVPEIAAVLKTSAALPAALNAGIEETLTLSGKVDTSVDAMRSSLAAVSESLSRLVALEQTAAAADRTDAGRWILVAIAAAVLASVAIGTVLVVVIQRPIRALTAGMTRLAAGDTDVTLTGAERRDEIGDMTRAVVVFRDNAVERQRLEAQAAEEARMRSARQADVDGLIRRFESTIGRVLEKVSANGTTLQHTADRLEGIAGAAAAKADSATAASSQASSNVQTVASAAEELSASIGAISEQVARTRGVVEDARTRAQATNGQIASLSEAATRIGDVVKLISSIAEQTNLLALNATIEAARAGEAGRGFSVVAGEVKNLATQTAKATEDIARQIAEIQESTADAVEAIQSIVATMEDVDRSTAGIATSVEQQGTATQEITLSVTQAAHGTTLVVGDMKGLSTSVAETSQTAGAVLAASGEMRTTAEELKREVDAFLKGVAAA